MYEARQNKEKVSRRIDSAGEVRQNTNVKSKRRYLHQNKKLLKNYTQNFVQLKIINCFKNNKNIIDEALEKIKKNQYGKVIYRYLDEELTSEIKIIEGELSNASKDEIRIKIADDDNLDSTILHEMIHVTHANIDNEQFNLAGIYRNLLKIYFLIIGKQSPKNLIDRFGEYFNLQEEELVTQEWEKKYNDSENSKNKRSIPVRGHYMDESRFTKGENTGRLTGEDRNLYIDLYNNLYIDLYKKPIPSSEDFIDISRLNSYDDFKKILEEWLDWINTNVTEEKLKQGQHGWRIEEIIKDGNELKNSINEKIKHIKTVSTMLPKVEKVST